jgi:chromosome partitioning protein
MPSRGDYLSIRVLADSAVALFLVLCLDAQTHSLLRFRPMADLARTAHVLTVLNLKGGVGKTHTSWVLASVAQEREKRILLVDLDTQGNLSKSFLDKVTLRESVAMLFDPSAETDALSLVQRTAFSHIDILPSAAALAPFDESDQRKWEKTDGHLSLLAPIESLRRHYDFIVFDCPPRLSLVSFAALCASDHLIVPLEAADWGAQGVQQVTDAMNYVRERFNPRLNLLGYLVSRFQGSRTYQRTYSAGLRSHFGALMFDTTLNNLADFERSVTDRIPITLLAPERKAAQVARNFFDEVCRRIAARPQSAASAKPRPRAAVGVAAGK